MGPRAPEIRFLLQFLWEIRLEYAWSKNQNHGLVCKKSEIILLTQILEIVWLRNKCFGFSPIFTPTKTVVRYADFYAFLERLEKENPSSIQAWFLEGLISPNAIRPKTHENHYDRRRSSSNHEGRRSRYETPPLIPSDSLDMQKLEPKWRQMLKILTNDV